MTMELDKLAVMNVNIFGDPSSSIKVHVKVNGAVKADVVHGKVCEVIGLSEASRQYFTLVHGYGTPLKRYRPSDDIALNTQDVTLRKWVFDIHKENNMYDDHIAVDLLCKHANHEIVLGNLKPSQATQQQLDGCMEQSAFCPSTQYLKLCQGIARYDAVCFHHCSLCEGYNTPDITLSEHSDIMVRLFMQGLLINDQHNEGHHVSWSDVRTWSRSVNGHALYFEVVYLGRKTVLHFTTPQVDFALAVLMEIVGTLLKKRKQTQGYFASDIIRTGQWIKYSNILYDPGVDNPVFDHSPTDAGSHEPP